MQYDINKKQLNILYKYTKTIVFDNIKYIIFNSIFTVKLGANPPSIVDACKGNTLSETFNTLILNGVADFIALPPPPPISVAS